MLIIYSHQLIQAGPIWSRCIWQTTQTTLEQHQTSSHILKTILSTLRLSLISYHLPSYGINGDSEGFPIDVCDESGAVWATQLSNIDGISQSSPVCRVVAEPVHSGVIGPIKIPSDPVCRNIPRSPEVWTLIIQNVVKF